MIWTSKKASLFVGAQIILVSSLYAQQRIEGTVRDQQGKPLQSITVIGRRSGSQTQTDANGKFRLDVQQLPDTLQFRSVGYQPLDRLISSTAPLIVELTATNRSLDEVVVVGYGTQSRRMLTTAISKVDGKALENVPVSTVGEGLKGKVAGARVYQSNNSPGADPVFRIRGGSSINKTNDPLVLVDGVERSFSGVNPNDVESIEVLKDAASTAIYGSRASNGVVLITTKKGKTAEQATITFDATYAFQQPESKLNMMSARDYIQIVRPAVALSPNPNYNSSSGYSASSGNDANSIYSTRYLQAGEAMPAGYESMPDPLDPSKTLIFQDNNYQDLLFRNVGWQNYYVGVNGGSQLVRYAASAGYTDDAGVALGTGYNRFSARGKGDVSISKKLSINTAFDYSLTNSQEFDNQTNVIARGLATPATQKMYFDNGRPTPGYNATSPNPLWWDYTRDYGTKDRRLSLIGGLDYAIIDGLKAQVQLSNYSHLSNYHYFEKAHEFSGLRTTRASQSQLDRTKVDALLKYDANWNTDHTLSLLGGYSYQQTDFNSFNATVNGASSDKVPTLSAGPNKTGAEEDIWQQVLIGYFGRANYAYKQKYLLMGTFRYDGSSLFAKENRWGFFPGVSAGWVVTQEPFMRDQQTVNYLKFRTSYGQTGNNSIGLYDALGKYSTDIRYDGAAGIYAATMPNRDLTWETSTQFDFGFDLALFNNRINIQADYFNKITKNLLFSVQLPNTSGFSTVQTNVGKVRFRGFDLEIGSENMRSGKFRWDSKLTLSFVKNRVQQLPDNGRDKNRIGGIQLADGTAFGGTAEGESLYRYFGYKVDHILQTPEEAAAARYDESARGWSPTDKKNIKGRKLAGDYEWQDRDGDGVISSKDQYELGVSVPHTTGGLANNFSYGSFGLNIFVDWALGHSINHTAYMRYFMNTFANNYTLVDEVNQTWKNPGDQSKYARFTANDPDTGNSNFSRTSDVFNYKGDYLCLREVSFLYQLPDTWSKRIGIRSMQLSVSGQNLFYFSALRGTGISPELGAGTTYGNDYYNYPAIRKIAIGAKLTL